MIFESAYFYSANNFSPLDKRGNDIAIGDEVKYQNTIFTVVDILSDYIVDAENDKGRAYTFRSDKLKRVYRPLHVEAS